jgi:hypothetical protein
MAGLECVKRGSKSERTDMAREEVMTCGRVIMGRDIVINEGETKSYKAS